jgi:dihydrolipoamide dehydrogenase
MAEHFQLAVIGAGPGGYVAALKASQLGAKVAVIEKHHLGGTCLNYGCIPSKALLSSAELLHQLQHAGDWGISLNGTPSFDWTAIQKRKDKVISNLRGGIAALFKARKVVPLQGAAKLDGLGKITVLGEKGPTQITADKVILAVGSVPARIPGWPTDPEIVCTSDEAVHWKDLPKRLLIVGGGVIGCEFACMMQAFGVAVTVVEMLPGLLPGIDAELGSTLAGIFKKRGIAVYTDVKVNDLKMVGPTVAAALSNGKTVEADRVLVATGRKPNTREIGLETIGIESSPRGFVKVNDFMETSVKGYYCIGDANGRALLAHAASAHGVVASENALAGGHESAFTAPIPGAVYTFPEIGSVGLGEAEARDKGLPIAIGKFPIGHLGKAMATNHTDGFVKLLKHRETGELLGAHVLGHNATEVIAACGTLLHQKVTLQDVAETVWAHPTISEAVKEAAEDALGVGLHLPPRKLIRVTA